MNKVIIMKNLFKRMEDEGIDIKTLKLHDNGDVSVNDLGVKFTYDGTQATIYYNGGARHIGFIEDLVPEIMNFLCEDKWEAGKEVRKGSVVRTLVYAYHNHYNLLDTNYFDLEYESAFTIEELKEVGWDLVN